MKILAIDTATEACSAALYIDGIISEQYQLAPREHTKLILKMIESLLNEASLKITELDAFAFGRGPGSFTGVRIATGVVQGLAFASELPVIPISTLAAIAQLAYENHKQKYVLAGIDARMGEMYWGRYHLDATQLMTLSGDEVVSSAQVVSIDESLSTQWCGAGSAWDSYLEPLKENLGEQIDEIYADYFPRSACVVKLAVAAFLRGEAVEVSQALPVYLRNDVAKKKAEQLEDKGKLR
jgi:tRNA threonylcarbamoyladenosine biosynthesis protein TsaB